MQRDWVGNTTSIFAAHGASNHVAADRAENDYYATEPKATTLLLQKEKFAPTIWECAVGGGHIAEILKSHGYKVLCSDIIDRGYPGTIVFDFLQNISIDNDFDIITNPPYKYAQEFVEKALQCISDKHKVAMFLKLTFLEGKKRKRLFENTPPARIYVSSSRLNCVRNGDFSTKVPSSAVAYAWFVWEKGFKGKPTIDWIN